MSNLHASEPEIADLRARLEAQERHLSVSVAEVEKLESEIEDVEAKLAAYEERAKSKIDSIRHQLQRANWHANQAMLAVDTLKAEIATRGGRPT
jgi:chromosome segregation ATPase